MIFDSPGSDEYCSLYRQPAGDSSEMERVHVLTIVGENVGVVAALQIERQVSWRYACRFNF